MSVRRVLREALATVQKAHCAPERGLALTGTGERCEALSPAAAAWTSVGALILADPVRREPEDRDTHGDHGWKAYLLLREAALQQGFRNTVEVDRAGQRAAVRMFWRALQLASEGHARHGARTRSRSTPGGDTAA